MPDNDRVSHTTLPEQAAPAQSTGRRFICDRCGETMVEDRCKVSCPNCGSRLDCSDLNLYFDELVDRRE